MPEPRDKAEYLRLFEQNTKIKGFGLNVSQEVPCPFCAAPGFMEYRIIDCEEMMSQEHVCKECGRGSKALFRVTLNTKSFEFVQTQGPDQPAWLLPSMRRI